jgi:benzoylformate decarboxylase
MGMLYNSYRSGTPLVVYAGQHPQRGATQEPILAGDLVRMAEPVTKWALEAQDAAEIPVLLRRAFKSAAEAPRGPVFISVPANVMDEEAELEISPSNQVQAATRPDAVAIERLAAMLADASTTTTRSRAKVAGRSVNGCAARSASRTTS